MWLLSAAYGPVQVDEEPAGVWAQTQRPFGARRDGRSGGPVGSCLAASGTSFAAGAFRLLFPTSVLRQPALPLCLPAPGPHSCLWLLTAPSAGRLAHLHPGAPWLSAGRPRALSPHAPLGRPAAWARGLRVFLALVSIRALTLSPGAGASLRHPLSSGL